jgi:hypothetical protein
MVELFQVSVRWQSVQTVRLFQNRDVDQSEAPAPIALRWRISLGAEDSNQDPGESGW